MKRRNQTLFVVAAAWLGLFPLAATATLITFDFSVTATDGPLVGTTANGSFTFDSSSIPATLPGFNVATGLLTALHFTWDGVTYNAGTANTGDLEFDGAGDLIGALFGTNCDNVACVVSAGHEQWNVEFAANSFFIYAIQGVPESVFFGTASLGPRVTVPEPATLALLGFGLAGLAFSRRKQ